ncbi:MULTISPECIES: tRNA glutamyl-Q(34) synthetase GluQRS [Tatumella]|uniref:Glutamyl-Q tRNA(Asp) synthetase n=1 Tax=Tatumella punctata TaxID=399969 RepID=A0ABW1VNK5_9GAMM|nr:MULTISPECIES: tRNA glutamyl-Q(34) synthetase GluQRS [unclassified Tatumella]MBS0856115.1 tRNA glutamyl-Q(34) synthetase GluQRS [Tatumella sp. JGM16]MBS0877473.1 tRNA glutamyl-Q(34) synthetase GluQRS [Tatumella sp. JGM82]MBS0890985.1 tRNA glutamyl-Q(34) synthetase GluQRS [Tatumella sp. JGM94]MBS0894176.1 tRNA glutamyl-Q(34) synthetase GluQRS [Tatumella sp. JGM130]MBS0901999.1 tRNA glutamyl-Q(34) synthetase GluQRS [Tatumella sp. JGM100]
MTSEHCCTGRFAPSPSGALHFGSLIAALGSYLNARARQGRWWVRIEDIDPPREIPGAASTILHQLEHYGLHWDGDVLWQSQRSHAYRDIIQQLISQHQSYFCDCTRSRIRECGGYYDGHCRQRSLPAGDAALRIRQLQPVFSFHDRLRGEIVADPALAAEDFIIHRRDGLFAYNLAVVVDDHSQGVSEIVRGADLIVPTVRQISLYQQLGWPVPDYLHLPLALNRDGHKLSKQNHAPPLPEGDPRPVLVQALRFLGQTVSPRWQDLSRDQLLSQAICHWTTDNIPINDALIPEQPLTAFSNCSQQAMISR